MTVSVRRSFLHLPAAVGILVFTLAAPADAQRLPDGRAEATLASEGLSPDASSTGMHRLDLRGGVWLAGFHLFGAGTAWGQEHGRIAPGTDLLIATGVDTTFTLPIDDGSPIPDSVDVVFPEFVEWDDGPSMPFERSDSADLLLRATYALPGGDVGVAYRGARAQLMRRAFLQLYNPQGWDAAVASDREIALDGRMRVATLAGGDVSVEVNASRFHSLDRTGVPDPTTTLDQQEGIFGFETEGIEFLAGDDPWDYDDELGLAYRFDALPVDFFQILPGTDLRSSQTVGGVGENLRINPYGMRTGFHVSGFAAPGGIAYAENEDEGTRVAGALEWARPESIWLRAGADWGKSVVDRVRMPLGSGRGFMQHNEPTRTGLWAKLGIDRAEYAVSGGLRWDRVDPGGDHARVPGFASFIPDSMKRDFVVADPDGSGLITFTELTGAPCNGFTSPTGSTPCIDNFVAAEVQSALGFDVHFVARLAGGVRVGVDVADHLLAPLAPAGQPGADIPAIAWTSALFSNAEADFATGLVGSASAFGRDVDLPRQRTMELGFTLPAAGFVFETSIFTSRVRDGLGLDRQEFISPVTGSDFTPLVLVNRDADAIRGVDLLVSRRIGTLSEVEVGYVLRGGGDIVVTPFTVGGVPVSSIEPVFATGAWSLAGFGPTSNGVFDAQRKHTIRLAASLLGSPARADLLADAGLRAELRFASGLEYDRIINRASGVVGPPSSGIGVDESTPWVDWLALRVHKGIPVAGGRLRAFAEWSGSLSANQSQVFLETGSAENDEFRESQLLSSLGDQNLDFDTDIDDFFVGDCMEATPVLCEVPGNDLNAYALMRAEDRFGDGDGLFTVEEQRAAFGAWYDLVNGPQWLRRSERSLRLGMELRF